MSQGTRRLAAILFTDMIGYTALGQRNESLSLALVEEQKKLIRPILRRHGGREVKTIGDSFMVEFMSGLDSIRCAYDIQRAVREFNISSPEERRIHLRVGIHLGDVVESDGDISGDAVNVASRIEALAEDGGVCMTRQVYDQVHNKFGLQLESLGPKPLKNLAWDVEVFKIVMPWETPGKAEESALLDKRRVAVLPFANMSRDPNDAYLADGITEEIISTVSNVSGLSVISRTSAMGYKGTTKRLKEIGRELEAGTILEGSVRKGGSKIRITAKLVDVNSDSHIWAQSYDRELNDIFAIQSDIARQVAEALQVRILTKEKKRLEKVPTSNIDAYTLYLKGQYYSNRGVRDDYEAAIGYYEQAIANDPNFALALVGIARAYLDLGFYGMVPSGEASANAKKYAQKALGLDDSLADAHLAMAGVLTDHDWDFAGAEREIRHAIELNPNLTTAHLALARLLMLGRRFEEGIMEARRGIELDPLSPDTTRLAGTVFLYANRLDDAIDQFTRRLAADPKDIHSRNNLALTYVRKGMVEEGVEELERIGKSPGDFSNLGHYSDLAYAYAKAGKQDKLRALLQELVDSVHRNTEFAVDLGVAYGNLGDQERALEWLERAYSERLSYLASANCDFAFDCVRTNPRFQALMKNMGWTNTL